MARGTLSVEEEQNFRSRCEREQKAHEEWPNKWGMLLDVYKYYILSDGG